MKKDKLLGEDLITLQKERGKICISLIIPTHRLFSDRTVDRFEVEKAVSSATQFLESKYTNTEIKPLIIKMKEIASTIDFDHNLDGIGMYISPNVGMMVRFPFAVDLKIVVGDNFEIRDLLYSTNISKAYYALLLSEKHVRLFEGSIDQLTEIRGKHFPYAFYDDYEYSPPSRGSSITGNAQMRSFEHDKSTMEAIRIKEYFRKADEYLGDYMVQDMPLVVTGVGKNISLFESVTAFNTQIVGTINGNYDHVILSEFGIKCWNTFDKYLKQEIDDMIVAFKEDIGRGHGITGIQDIWTAVHEGRGKTLLVEKDFKVPGFTTADHAHFLTLRPPMEKHATIPDAVDEIIETMIQKGGDVYFTEEGKLQEFGRIVLMTRY